jgi:hypothetical protein
MFSLLNRRFQCVVIIPSIARSCARPRTIRGLRSLTFKNGLALVGSPICFSNPAVGAVPLVFWGWYLASKNGRLETIAPNSESHMTFWMDP